MNTHTRYLRMRAYWVTAAIAGGALGVVGGHFTGSGAPILVGIAAGLFVGWVLAIKRGSCEL